MATNTDLDKRQRRSMAIVVAYPIGVLLVAVVFNFFVFSVNPYVLTLPTIGCIHALVIAAVLLTINHTWIMTTTELTRVRFKMYSTPEEWAASRTNRDDVPEVGVRELERHHNTHRNTTENTIYYVLLALAFVFASPTLIAAQVWLIGFAVARLGYTYSYLAGKDGARGLFMSLSLLAMYGMASYLLMSLVI